MENQSAKIASVRFNGYAFNDASILPEDMFTRIDDSFFSVVKSIAGESLCKILQLQMINSARKLLNTIDVYSFVQIESEEINAIKIDCCFKSSSGQCIVKPGIRADLSILIKLLRRRLVEEEESLLMTDKKCGQEFTTEELIKRHPLLK